MATHIHHRQRKPKKICAPELPLTKQHYLLFHGLFLCSQPKVTAIFRSIMLKPSGNPNGIYPTWCSFLCHFADVGLCSMFASNSALKILDRGGSGLVGFCVSADRMFFFLHGEKRWLCTDPKGAIEYEQRIWINDDAGNPLPIGLFDAWMCNGRLGPGGTGWNPIRWVFATICFLRKVRGIHLISSPRCRRFS